MSIDLKGNTNFVSFKNLQDQYVVPRTNLAAVDMDVANGLAVTGSTLYVNLATAEDIEHGTTGHLVDAVGLNGALDAAQHSYRDIIQQADIPTRSIQPAGQTAAITAYVLEPGNAYKIVATNANRWLATTSAFKAAQNTWGPESHIELFVAGTGYVHTDDNVVLSTPLEPDAVNNCTIRFHDGKAIISVEDTIAGYIVVTATGSSNGSLAYGLANNVGEYIAFNDTLAGTVIDLGGVTTYNGEKHVVGNGYTDTIISGAINCTNKTTFANLAANGVVVTGGTLTLGDVYIPDGSTVSQNTGTISVEKVTGDGGTIDFGDKTCDIKNASAEISHVTLKGGTTGVAFVYTIGTAQASLTLRNCTITASRNSTYGAIEAANNAVLTVENCVFESNTATGSTGQSCIFNGYGATGLVNKCTFKSNNTGYCAVGGNNLTIKDCTFEDAQKINITGGTVYFGGSNAVLDTVFGTGALIISSGAIIDLTGNTNATPIAPGGGITFESGGATVKVGDSTASSSYMMDNVTLPEGAKLTNTAVVDMGGTTTAACYGSASGATIVSGSFRVREGATAANTTVNSGGWLRLTNTATATSATVNSGGVLTVFSGGVANEPIINTSGTLVVSSGGSALLVTSNTGASVVVNEGGYITYK